MLKNILPLIPEHHCYVEPFCGGASLFFAKEPSKVEIINDINNEIIFLYQVAKKYPQEFLNKLEEYQYSEYWHQYFKKNKNIENEIERAVGIYIRIQWSFAKVMDKGFAFSKKVNQASRHENKLESLHITLERLKNVTIMKRDAKEIIELFDSEDTFFYCDPPYPNTDQGNYKGYTQQDFDDLINVLLGCKGSFILSCYENEAVPKHWKKYEFETVNYSSKIIREKRKEILWVKNNFSNKQKDLFEEKLLEIAR